MTDQSSRRKVAAVVEGTTNSSPAAVRAWAASPLLVCTAETHACPDGSIALLLVAGEIDRCTHHLLRAALDALPGGDAACARRDVVVDLAGVTFCSVCGFALLADAAAAAAEKNTGFAVCGMSARLQRYSRWLWACGVVPREYPSSTAAITAIQAERAASA